MTGPTVSLQLLHFGNEILPISHNLPKRALCMCVCARLTKSKDLINNQILPYISYLQTLGYREGVSISETRNIFFFPPSLFWLDRFS